MPSRNRQARADYRRVSENRRSLQEIQETKPKPVSPGVVRASIQADRVRRPYTGRLSGNVGPEHRAGGVR